MALAPGLMANEPGRSIYPRLVIETGPHQLRWTRVENVAAYRFSNEKWSQIPVQIDERNRRGDFVLNEGLPFTKGSDDGYVDDNDDVVFWGPDFGEPFNDDQIPGEVLAASRSLWRLEIKSGSTSFGHILVVSRSDVSDSIKHEAKVKFDPDSGVVETDKYHYQFRKDHAALLGHVALKKDGQYHPLFANSEFLLDLRLPWYLPNFSLTQDNFTSAIESWQIGPLRTIVAVGVKFRGFLSLFNLHLFSELSFSSNGFQIPTKIEFPIDPKSNFKPGTGIAYGISFAEDLNWQLRSNLESLPAKSPEVLFQSAKRASGYPYFYALGKSPYGGVLVRVKVDKKAAEVSLPPYLVGSDIDAKDYKRHWPWIDELNGDVKVFLDISSVAKGSYDFGLDLILEDEASEDVIVSVDALRTHWSGITPSSR